MTRRLVLDTNVAAYASLEQLLPLERFGLPVSISDMALSETWASSVRSNKPSKLTARFRKIAPLIDPTYPVAVGGAMAIAQARWLASDGRLRPPPELVDYQAHAREAWERILSGDLPEGEWRAVGSWTNAFLDDTDARHTKLVEPLREKLRNRARQRGDDVETLERSLEEIPPTRLRIFNILAIRDVYGADVGDRLDALSRVLAWRGLTDDPLAKGKKNDGADYRLLLHLAEGAMVITDEVKLRRLIDASGSPQRAWVRSLEELRYGIPQCDPWGDAAIEASRTFGPRPFPHPKSWPLGAPPYGSAWTRPLSEADLDSLVHEAERLAV